MSSRFPTVCIISDYTNTYTYVMPFLYYSDKLRYAMTICIISTEHTFTKLITYYGTNGIPEAHLQVSCTLSQTSRRSRIL